MTDNRDMPEEPRAFPLPSASFGPSGDMSFPEEGMLLRDWFAGQALAGLISQGAWSPSELAEHAYRAADQMLTERTKRDSQ